MPDIFSAKLCDERHDDIKDNFDGVDDKMKTLDNRLWAIIVLLVLNFGTLIISILSKQ